MLRDEIYRAFDEMPTLGLAYSLADYDFFDTNRCFPNKGYIWIKDNLKLDKARLIPANWTDSEIEELKFQLENSCTVNKQYLREQVRSDYIERHYFGLVHLHKNSFIFYFPIWMANFLENDSLLPMSSTFFFKNLSSLSFYDEDFFNWLNESQKKVVIQFLTTVSNEYTDDAYLALTMWESAMPQ